MYKVHNQTQSNKARQARIGFTVLGIAVIFVSIFLATQAIMTAVYGLPPLEANGSAYIGAGAAAVIESETTNTPIDNYISTIKESVCPTLKNVTAEAECFNI